MSEWMHAHGRFSIQIVEGRLWRLFVDGTPIGEFERGDLESLRYCADRAKQDLWGPRR